MIFKKKPRNDTVAQLGCATVHELKTLPEFFGAVAWGKKTFEVRRDDRGFEVGDVLVLREYDPTTGYTGARLAARVTYILRDERYVKEGYAVMAIENLWIKS